MWSDLRGADALADAAAIRDVLAGEPDRFADIVRRHQAAMYRYAVSMVLDHDVAADMVQDAFVRAYASLATCRDHLRFRAWLFQTLRNRCLDHLKQPRRKNVPLDHADSTALASAPAVDPIEHTRLRQEITRALMELPPAQREAFLMHCVEETPYEAMAELLDASVSALKMRVMRAREALCKRLGHRRDQTERPSSFDRAAVMGPVKPLSQEER